MRRDRFRMFKDLLPWIAPHKNLFAIGGVFVCASTALEIFLPIVIGKAVDAVLLPDNITLLKNYCTLFLILILLKTVVESGQAYVIQFTGQKVIFDLRASIFKHLCSLPIAYFDRNPTGRLLTRVINDIKSLSELFTASMSVLILDTFVIVGTVFAMLTLNWKLGLLILSTFPVIVFVISHFGKRLAEAYRKVRAKLSEINGFLGETVGALPTVQRLSAEEERRLHFKEITAEHRQAQMDSLSIFALVQPITNVANGIAMAVLLGVGGYAVMQGHISVGVIVIYLGYMRNLFQPVRDLVEKYNTFLSSKVSLERITEILNEKTEESEGIETLPKGWEVEFQDVTFTYPTRALPAIEQITFKIESGKSLAVVGRTGSGKSTLIRLLLRFYHPTKGKIFIGGRPIQEYSLPFLRRHIGVVQQEVFLFRGRLRENLLLGEKEEDSVLIETLKKVQLWDLVEKRGGLEMEILEGGSNLSLGERQLVSFARVLIRNPPILIFDEATSSIDRLMEDRLLKAISQVVNGRTSIMIAHRLATLSRSDSLITIENGRLVA